jgi:hypothetical protein
VPDVTPATDPAAAILAGIKADHKAANPFDVNANDPVPRLVAAVEAALKEADDFEVNRPERLVTRRYAAECFRAAITRGVAGEDAGDGAT